MTEFKATKDVRNIVVSALHVDKRIYREQEQLLKVLEAWIKCLNIEGQFVFDDQWPYTPRLYNDGNYDIAEVKEKGDEYIVQIVEHKEYCILTYDQVIPLPVEIM